jgi:small conductance mechanosensitive channel
VSLLQPAQDPGNAAPPEPDGVVEGLRERAELADSLRQGQWEVILDQLREMAVEALRLLPLVVLALLVLLLFAWLARTVGRWERPYRRLSPSPFVRDLIRQGARTGVLLAGVLLALEIVNATGLAAAVLGTAGVLGLAIGFAFKDLVENYIAGVLLSLRQPFGPNDHVVIDGHEGKVIRLTSRAAILMTLDGNHLRIPNAQVFKGVMTNYSRNPRRRFGFTVGVGTAEDLPAALVLGVETLRATEGVLAEPVPEGYVEELGDSAVVLRFHGWVDQRESSFAHARSTAVLRVKDALEARGMDLPEPIYRVRMEGSDAAARKAGETEAREPEPRPPEPTPPETPPPAAPTGDDAIDRQIAEERAETPADEDLLRSEAPQE